MLGLPLTLLLFAYLAVAGCSYLPSPQVVAEYRDVCAAKEGAFSFGLDKRASTDWGPTFNMKCDAAREARP